MVLAGFAAFTAPFAAPAQMLPPFPSPEVAEIAACLCLKQAVDAFGADASARRQSYDGLQEELAQVDVRMQRERATMNVDDPQSGARFRQLLERRDALFRRASGPAVAELASSIERYNSSVSEFNVRCANRPRDPGLLAAVQATLSCPPF